MGKDNLLIIDLDTWTTQKDYAKLVGKEFAAIRQQLKRTKKGTCKEPLEYLDVPELNITLIKK